MGYGQNVGVVAVYEIALQPPSPSSPSTPLEIRARRDENLIACVALAGRGFGCVSPKR
jgi:hypothetical protein